MVTNPDVIEKSKRIAAYLSSRYGVGVVPAHSLTDGPDTPQQQDFDFVLTIHYRRLGELRRRLSDNLEESQENLEGGSTYVFHGEVMGEGVEITLMCDTTARRHRSDRPGTWPHRFAPYFRLLMPVRFALAGALVLGTVYGLTGGLGLPFAAEKIFPVIFTDPPPPDLKILSVVLILPLIFLIRGLTGFYSTYLSNYCGIRVLVELQTRVFESLQYVSLSFFDRQRTGDLMARVIGDAAELQRTITQASNLIKQPITLLAALGYVVYLVVRSPDLAFVLLCLGLIPVVAIPVRLVGDRMLHRATQMRRQAGSMGAIVQENLIAAKEIRLFNLQRSQVSRMRSTLAVFKRLHLKLVKYTNLVRPTVELLTAIGAAATIFYAARSGIAMEDLMPLVVALMLCFTPVRAIGEMLNQFKRATASLDRIVEIMESDEVLEDPTDPVSLERARGHLELCDVSFRYGDEFVLSEIREEIAPGEIVALVGRSGAGKTSLCSLIPRLYEATLGQVRVDGVDVRHYLRRSLRSQIAVVPQDPILFNDTIRNNILLGRPDATEAEAEAAAREAFAHDFIMEFAAGYDTFVGDRGIRLSGGQKQRVAMARAFLRDAPVLILDEATSNLDSESETTIHNALKKLVRDRTTLIISHRLSTLHIADRILVLDRGRIVDRGAHSELLDRSEDYRALCADQLGAA